MSFFADTVPDLSGEPDPDACEQILLDNPPGSVSLPPPTPGTVSEPTWLILVAGTQSAVSVWFAYRFSSRDIPGYFTPGGSPYTGLLTAPQIAQTLKDSGVDVRLKLYENFTLTPAVDVTDVPLT